MKIKKCILLIFLVVFILQLFQLLYFNRGFLFRNYDVFYWKDRFEHSQWVMPLSNRIIGDDGLYAYIGYTLVKGEDPSKNNPEAPPVAKYLIGFSIAFFKNPIFYSIVMGFLSLFAFYLLAKKLLKDKISYIFVSVLLFLDPLFFSQFLKPWVDITQLFLLLLNILFLVYSENNNSKKLLYSLASGLSLGFFVQTKLPILFPVIFILQTLLFFKNKAVKNYLAYLLGFILGIIIPYSQYFLLGHSPVDFLKLQKYILVFYAKSQLVSHIGAIWQALIFGVFPDIASNTTARVAEWTLLWPFSLVISALSIYRIFKSNYDYFLKGLGFFVLLGLLIFGLIPSYPRYLLLLLPFIYLFLGYFVNLNINKKFTKIILILILGYGLFNSFMYLNPRPEVVLNDFYYNFSHEYFQDIYKQDLSDRQISINENKFRIISQTALEQAQVRNIKITEIENNINTLSGSGYVRARFIYQTLNLGSFSEIKQINLVREQSQWKVVWDWGLVLNKFKPGYGIDTILVTGKRGTIFDSSNNILATDDLGYLISVNPEKIDTNRENEMLDMIGKLTSMIPVRLQNTYLENSIPGEYIPLATTFSTITHIQKNYLLSFKGVVLSDYPTRLYNSTKLSQVSMQNTYYPECCSRIYSTFNYHGVNGPEKEFDSKLSGYDGGEIDMRDANENLIRTIIKKQPKNGQDVKLAL